MHNTTGKKKVIEDLKQLPIFIILFLDELCKDDRETFPGYFLELRWYPCNKYNERL